MLGAKSSGGGRPWKERCRHLRNATILTSAALSLFSTAAREIHISNASRHTGVKGGELACGRADLIKQQATTVRSPHFAPRRLISLPQSEGIKVTECNHCLLSANEENGQGRDWVTGRLWRVRRVNFIELWLGRKWHVMRRAGAAAAAAARYHGRGFSRREATGRKSSRNETCLYVKLTMSFTR